MAKSRTPHRPSLGILFWIAAILLIAIVLMFSLPSIRQVLESTDFVDVVFEGTPPESPPPGSGDGPAHSPSSDQVPIIPEPGPAQPEAPDLPPSDPEAIEPGPSEEVAEQPESRSPDAEEIDLVPPPDEEPRRTMRSTVFFIRVTDDGRIVAEAVPRTIQFTRSPLTHALEALIAGPDADDLNSGLLSLLPSGSQLMGARVEDGVAYLNFNEEFRFNSMGLEGHIAQLQQVVLTATTFSTVDAVQILIDGRRVDYLGGDGVYIGQPLTPADFRS